MVTADVYDRRAADLDAWGAASDIERTVVDYTPKIEFYDQAGKSLKGVHETTGTMELGPGQNIVVDVKIGTSIKSLTIDSGAARTLILSLIHI